MRKKKLAVSLLLIFGILLSTTAFSFARNRLNQFSSNYPDLQEKSQELFQSSEWVHSIVLSEYKDRPFDQLEDWRLLDENGEIIEIYEWAIFGDDTTPAQEAMYKEGYWVNLVNQRRWRANNAPYDSLDFTPGLTAALQQSKENGEEITGSEELYNGTPVIKYSLENSDGIYDDVVKFRKDYYLDNKTGYPIVVEVYTIKQDGSEELRVKTTYQIESGINPPEETILQMEKISSEADGISSTQPSRVLAAPLRYSYYEETSKSQPVTVSGLSVTSRKNIYPYTFSYSMSMYTGTSSTMLQEAGANWFSFQEYCNGTYRNIYNSTIPDISSGVSNWYRSTGYQDYRGACDDEHELYVNGSHYAKYNYTIMSPSPDFAIWWSVPLTN